MRRFSQIADRFKRLIARQMRSDLGQFMASDPLSMLPGYAGAQETSPYTYVQNNPLGFVDPTGL